LLPSLRDAASATDVPHMYHVLQRLLHQLRDNHGEVTHPDVVKDAVIPLIARRIGDRGIVVTKDQRFLPAVKPGDELVAIDGRSFLDVFNDVSSRISSATSGFLEFAAEFDMVNDQVGKTHSIRVRSVDGVDRTITVAAVSTRDVAQSLRDPHPKTGDHLAPGVVYLDLDVMDDASLQKVMPDLVKATSVIMDLRGYLKKAAYRALAHFAHAYVPGPILQVPLVEDFGPHKLIEIDSISIKSAVLPHVAGKLFVLVDGRAGSSSETFIQIVRNGKLGTLIGETSAGTNGNVKTIEVAGGFTVQFTGLRAVMDDGRVVQGNGFDPDIVVHQTVEGIRAGRDEILDAALRIASGK